MKKSLLLLLVLAPCYVFCQIAVKKNQYYANDNTPLDNSLGCYYYATSYADQGIDTAYIYYCSSRKVFSKTVKVDGISEGLLKNTLRMVF